MGRYAARITVERPVADVFAFLDDQRNHATLNPHNFRQFRVVSANSVGEGAEAEFVLHTGALRRPVRIAVTRSQPPQMLVEEGQMGDVPFQTTWRLHPGAAGQTIVELVTTYDAGSAGILFGNVIDAGFRRIFGRLLRDLKARLED